MATLFALLVLPIARAQDARFVLGFGGEPGAPLAHAYNNGAPADASAVYRMRVPTVDPIIKPIFVDTELTIDTASKIVQRVHAERAMSDQAKCGEAKDVIAAKLADAMPTPYTGVEAGWQYQTPNRTAVGGVICQVARYLPYPVLILDLAIPPPP